LPHMPRLVSATLAAIIMRHRLDPGRSLVVDANVQLS
jgi:hypothetical protein